jgi:hypothetical protein
MHRFLCLTLLLPLCSFVYAQDSVEKEFKTTPGKKLEMDLKTGGSIHVTGWDRDVVSIKASGLEDSSPRPDLNFEERASGVAITSRFGGSRHNNSHSNLRFEIQVPKKYDLHLESMGGDFSIQNVEGTMGGKTMGGGLDLQSLKGDLDLLTMGGAIILKNSDVNGCVKTMGGKVLVDHVSGNVKATTQGGNVTQRYVTNGAKDKPTGEVKISSMGGEINVDEAPAGADVHTMGGDVLVKHASDHVKAKTMGGNIEIQAVDGQVSATTMGGDIEVTMVGDPSKGDRGVMLQSMGGEISLTVPPALSMDIDIELAYTKDSRRNYRITSEFDLKQEESKEWDRSQGSPRKYINATGTIGDGKNKVRIMTMNGDVHLRKGK